jgi:hypothetical protein
MPLHPNAKLGPAGRRALVGAIERGATLCEAAACFAVAPATAHRWWHRWLAADAAARANGAWSADRSSRPRRSPRMLSATVQTAICAARRRTGWGPRLIAGELGRPHSTISKTLRRHGLSRLARPPRPAACRYEWPCPGDLLHMDTKRYACFERPGHAVTRHSRQELGRKACPLRLRVRPHPPRRSHPPGLQRAARRRARRDGDGRRRASPRLVRQPRHLLPTDPHRQRLGRADTRPQPLDIGESSASTRR